MDQDLKLNFKVNDDGSVVLDKITSKLGNVADHTEKMNKSLGVIRLDSMVNLASRAFDAGERIYNLARNVASATNDIERNAKIAGLSTDAYQKMAYAAKMADVNTESLSRGMKILAGKMDDVSKGSAEAEKLFESIGVKVTDAEGKTKGFDQIMGEIANRFKAMPDGVTKVARAVDLFGKAGQDLIPYLNLGSAGIKKLYEEAEKLGIVIGERLLKKGSELEDKFKVVGEVIWTTWMKIVVVTYEAIEAYEKYHKLILGGGLHKRAQEGLYDILSTGRVKTREQATRYGQLRKAGDLESGVEWGQVEPSAAAAKALADALKQASEQEAKMNAYFADDVELLKQANREIERRVKAYDLMEKLGVKTKIGAEREVGGITEQFKSLMGMGYSPEEMEKAKGKLTEELRAIYEKYKTPSGWMEEGEEGGVKWHRNIPESGLSKDVSSMVERATAELNRMQDVAESATKQREILINYSPVQNAKEAVEELRRAMESIDGKVITISIDGRMAINGGTIDLIESELESRYTNRRSRLGGIIEK